MPKDDGPLGLQSGPWTAFAKLVNPGSYGKPAVKAKRKSVSNDLPSTMDWAREKPAAKAKAGAAKAKSGKMKPTVKPAAKKKGK